MEMVLVGEPEDLRKGFRMRLLQCLIEDDRCVTVGSRRFHIIFVVNFMVLTKVGKARPTPSMSISAQSEGRNFCLFGVTKPSITISMLVSQSIECRPNQHYPAKQGIAHAGIIFDEQ